MVEVAVSQPVMNDVTDTHGADYTLDDIPATYDHEMESTTESDSPQDQRSDRNQGMWVFPRQHYQS